MEIPKITIYTKKEFRKWLLKSHTKESKVAVILYKRHTGKPAPTHRELMEEAICFGWIDTTIKRLDEDQFIRHFSKRNKNSRWSNNTIKYGKRLIREGKMTEVGLEFFKLGLAKPTHDHGLPLNPDMPKDLESALSKNTKAAKGFEAYPPSAKRMLYRWILRAKLPTTRKKRIKYIVQNAVKGIKLF
ncbi:MAG TPA: YdeI/OmpD-associated family protein [Candidatus Paceibacterota bacterium]